MYQIPFKFGGLKYVVCIVEIKKLKMKETFFSKLQINLKN